MTVKEIKELLKLVNELDLREVRIKNKEFDLKIRTDKDAPSPITGSGTVLQPNPVVQTVPAPAPVKPVDAESFTQSEESSDSSNYIEIKSPMVGTFYRSASPDKPPYVQVGDVISKGDVLCIIEAMKLFNEIESEVAGKIVKVMVDDSSPVEYDQVLFLVEA